MKNVIFQASLNKDCEAEEMKVQKKTWEHPKNICIVNYQIGTKY